MPALDTDSDDRTHADRKRVYHRVLRAVDAQTSQAQTPVCSRQELRTTLCGHANIPAEYVASAVQAAKTNGDLLEHEDPRNGRVIYVRRDIESLRAVHPWLIELETDTSALHEAINHRIEELKDDA